MKIAWLITLSVLLTACSKKHDFWPVSHFKMTKNAIADETAVTVIYYSRGPHDSDADEGFYRHAIVVLNQAQDTFNVLTFPNSDIERLMLADEQLIYNDHPIMHEAVKNRERFTDDMKEALATIDTTKLSWPTYKNVARDPKFDYIADNNYATVIGSLSSQHY